MPCVRVFDGLESIDDGSAAAPADAAAAMRFRRHYFANGQLIVREAATGAIWGRCDAFMPVNVDMGRTLEGMDATIAKLEQDAVARGGSWTIIRVRQCALLYRRAGCRQCIATCRFTGPSESEVIFMLSYTTAVCGQELPLCAS